MRRPCLAVACLSLALPALASAVQDADRFDKVQIKVSKVAGTVYLLEGAGGNIAASVGEDGVVLVDDQYAPLVEKIRAALKGVTDRPLRFILNTHYHGDHTGGNALLQKDAPVIAHDNVRARLAAGGMAGNLGSIQMENKPAEPAALPIITFGHDLTVHLNGEEVRALHVPSGHTDGDAVVFFPKSNVVHMGDDFVTYGFPFVDLAAGGSVKGLIAGLESVIAQLPPDVKVIPGHGQVSTLDDVRRYLAMVRDSRAAVERALAAGQTPEQMKAAGVLDPWKAGSGGFVSTDKWLETLVNELTGKATGTFVRH
ncbi:MAG TPA: MBL fold metallo-hydrolase [Vicinamibacteria bacterium]|nr:MBL fold metallo-hydrolase [Vicinamibacteria bacterium]